VLQRWVTRPLLELGYVVTALPVGAVLLVATVLSVVLGVVLVPVLLLGVPVLSAGVVVVRGLARAERARAALLLDARVPTPPAATAPDGGPVQRLRTAAADPQLRRELAYCLVLLPVAAVPTVLTVGLWSAGVLALVLAVRADLPGLDWPTGGEVAAALVGGVLLVLLARLATAALSRALVALARALLSPRPADALRAQVATLSETRARVVDAADAERRRIERDLHDGAQQHLVALALNLGRAKARFDEDPAGARALVDDAHREAKESITALRNVVRGVHPAVLTDRGLDAALSALAARSPIPVQLSASIPVRPDPTVEAVAYFVASETMTNAARHSGAGRLSVDVTSDPDRLVLVVADDGRGGATYRPDGGLAGLRDRVAAVDGTFTLLSPPGGGTTVTVEVSRARRDR